MSTANTMYGHRTYHFREVKEINVIHFTAIWLKTSKHYCLVVINRGGCKMRARWWSRSTNGRR